MVIRTEVRRLATTLLIIPFGAIALALVMVIGQTDVEYVSPERDETAITNDPNFRLAQTIAFRQGLIRLASPKEAQKIHLASTDQESGEGDDSSKTETDDFPPAFVRVRDLCGHGNEAQAIVAVESYLRPTWVRLLERDVSQSLETLFGLRPDWSYGPAQIRLSTARSILEAATARLGMMGVRALPELGDDALLARILDRCSAQELVALSGAAAGPGEGSISPLALRHLGGKPVPTLPGVISYESVVGTLATEVLAIAQNNFQIVIGDGETVDEPTDDEPVPAPKRISLKDNLTLDVVPLYCLYGPDADISDEVIIAPFGDSPDEWSFADQSPARLDIGLRNQNMVLNKATPDDMLRLLNAAQKYQAAFDPAGGARFKFFSLLRGHALYDLADANGCDAILLDPR